MPIANGKWTQTSGYKQRNHRDSLLLRPGKAQMEHKWLPGVVDVFPTVTHGTSLCPFDAFFFGLVAALKIPIFPGQQKIVSSLSFTINGPISQPLTNRQLLIDWSIYPITSWHGWGLGWTIEELTRTSGVHWETSSSKQFQAVHQEVLNWIFRDAPQFEAGIEGINRPTRRVVNR